MSSTSHFTVTFQRFYLLRKMGCVTGVIIDGNLGFTTSRVDHASGKTVFAFVILGQCFQRPDAATSSVSYGPKG